MCGRFVSASTPERIAAYFGAQVPESVTAAPLPDNFNVAPTNDIYGVVANSDGDAEIQVFQWGLVPVWAKEVKVGQKMINARSETLADKPAFKGVFRKHRCILPMDGFYEWAPGRADGPLTKGGKPVKRPHFIHRVDGEPLAVAGLWSAWRERDGDPDRPWLHSAAVVTTSANATMAPIHDRMPVILPRAMWQLWLDPRNRNIDVLAKLLVPAPDTLLAIREVAPAVNNVRNKGPELIAALGS